MKQNKEWLYRQLQAANIPEGTGKWEDYKKAKKHLVGEAIGRGDQRIWDNLQGAVSEYCGMKGKTTKPCHCLAGLFAPEQPAVCLEGTPNKGDCIRLEQGQTWAGCPYGGG